MRIEAHDHPLLSNVGNTQLVPNALDALQVTTTADVPLTLIPPFAVPAAAGSPPERASIPSKHTGIPMAVCQPQSVYFANQIGRLVWRYRLPDHQDLIANAVRSVAHLPIEVDGPHSLQVSLYRQGEGYIVHLINATGDRPLQDTIPLQNVRIRLCIEHTDMLVQTLLHSAHLACNVSDGILDFVVPSVETWEIVRCMPA